MKKIKVGDRVQILNSTLDGHPTVEGWAIIREIIEQDAEQTYARVEFENEPGQTYPRLIWEES